MRGLVAYILWMLIILSVVTGGLSNSLSINDPKDSHIVKTLSPTQPKNELALLVTLDGTIHLVDVSAKKKKVLWSLPSGRPIYSSYQTATDKDKDMHNISGMRSNFYIDIGADWKLYMHNGPLDQTEPVSIEDYLKKVPHISRDGGVTLGSKNSTLLLIDAETGQLLHTYQLAGTPSTSRIQSPEENAIMLVEDAEMLLKPGDQDLRSTRHLLYITRKDYVLQHTSLTTGKILWNLAFSEIEAEFQCQEIFSWTFENPKTEFNADHRSNVEVQLPCQGNVRVYRIRDTFFLGHPVLDSLGNAYSDFHITSLPAYYKPALADVNGYPLALRDGKESLVLKNEGGLVMDNEGRMLLNDGENPSPYQKGKVMIYNDMPDGRDKLLVALPSPNPVNHAMLKEFNENLKRNKLASGETIWSNTLLSICAILCVIIIAIIISAWKSKEKKNKEAEESKSQVKMLKKKKVRKSVNKNNNHIQGNLSCESKIEGNERTLITSTIHTDQRRIGKLIVSNKEIAKGSNGTIVLEGICEGRAVAVKRLVQTHHDVALKEIQNLIASDHHPNVVRWYGVEYDKDFVYLSLERCSCNLSDLIYMHSESYQSQLRAKDERSSFSKEYDVGLLNKDVELWKENGYPSPQLLKLMRDVVTGLAHLHELGIIHRDLKPQNVLIIKDRYLCAKISDMGISKRLPDNMSSLTQHPTGYGSSGWQAPEQLNCGRQTRAVDLFSLGCVLFFCITGGKHPYGDNFERDVNIVNDRKDLFLVEHMPEAMDLISRLLNPNPDLRPRASGILHHPFFWSHETRLSFLRDVSDRVELEDREKESDLLNELESIGAVAMDGKWDEKLETAFIDNIGRYRRYRYDSVRDLLRVIRNKLNHYRELPLEIQKLLGPVPEGFYEYFSSRFPRLLIETYKVTYWHCKNEESFGKYFTDNLL